MTPTGMRLVMLIDDEPAQQRLVSALAARAGWRTIFAADSEIAIATLGTRDGMMLDAVLLDHAMPDDEAVALIREIKARRHQLPILMLTPVSDVGMAVAAIRAGATDFLVKPVAPDRLLAALDVAASDSLASGELRPLTEKLSAPLRFDEIVGSTPDFRAAMAIAAKAARARVPVLIEGEPGVGKEMLAEAIHAASPRAKRPILHVNCAAIPANIIVSHLFGHEKGAFPGAFARHVGKIAAADGGTLFLDDIHSLSPEGQAALLSYVTTSHLIPLGARMPISADVRIVAAASGRLENAVAAGQFDVELYGRLSAVHCTLPPLRHRQADIAALSRHLLARITRQPGLRELGITDAALEVLASYAWPGNVRQLQNVLFRAAVLCDGDALTASDFPHLASQSQGRSARDSGMVGQEAGVTLYLPDGNMRPLEDIEADIIRLAIGHYRGRMTEVARRLGIGRSTLYRKLSDLGISEVA
jgi:DNA-binding NtrC family response regulator